MTQDPNPAPSPQYMSLAIQPDSIIALTVELLRTQADSMSDDDVCELASTLAIAVALRKRPELLPRDVGRWALMLVPNDPKDA